MSSKINKVNKLVETNFSEEVVGIWMSDSFQTKLKRTLKEKKEKTDDGEKRPLTPYIKFCQGERELVKRENPDLNTKEITSELGRRWNQCKKNRPEYLSKYGYVAK